MVIGIAVYYRTLIGSVVLFVVLFVIGPWFMGALFGLFARAFSRDLFEAFFWGLLWLWGGSLKWPFGVA